MNAWDRLKDTVQCVVAPFASALLRLVSPTVCRVTGPSWSETGPPLAKLSMPDRVRNVSGYHWSCTWMPRMVEPVWLDSVPLTVTVEVFEVAHSWGGAPVVEVTPAMEGASERERARTV